MMSKMSKRAVLCVIFSAVIATSLAAGAMFAYSKNISGFGVGYKDNIDGHLDRVAEYDVEVDGAPSDTVAFKAYATTKVTDIKANGNKFVGNSFKKDAYQLHTISVTNNSDVDVSCNINTVRTNNDDRVFFSVVDNVTTEQQLFEKLYFVVEAENESDMDFIRACVADYSLDGQSVTLKRGQTKTFTMVVWAEHDAVYPDNDGDGVADEDGKKLVELADGVPSETFRLDYTFTQID